MKLILSHHRLFLIWIENFMTCILQGGQKYSNSLFWLKKKKIVYSAYSAVARANNVRGHRPKLGGH